MEERAVVRAILHASRGVGAKGHLLFLLS